MRVFKWLDRLRIDLFVSLEPEVVFDDEDPTEPIPEVPIGAASCSTADNGSPDPSAEG